MAESPKKPHVLMMSEITADGKLTLKRGASSKILMKYMDPATEILLHSTRAEYDAIMVVSNTIKIDNSYLTVRHIRGKSPIRVIPSSMADIPPDAHVLSPDAPTIIAVAEKAPPDRVEALWKKGVTVLVAGIDHVSLPLLMRLLFEEHGTNSIRSVILPATGWQSQPPKRRIYL